jgi:hypothetical protein
VVVPKDDRIVVKLENTDRQIGIPKNSELKPYDENDEKAISNVGKILMKVNGKGKKGEAKSKKENSLAAIIDPMLLAGGKTVKEIADELAKKAGEAAKDKDLNANVRARMVSYTRKGWQVVKDDKKRVKVVQNKG